MRVWRLLPHDNIELYSPIGLRLIDEMTGAGPIGKVEAALEIADGSGGWLATEIEAVITPSMVVTYPGLGLRVDVSRPPQHYRVLVSADFYRPLYPPPTVGIEFDAHPYNHDHPPAVIVPQAQELFLMPAVNYPFPSQLLVLRGVVTDASGKAVVDAMVAGAKERVLSGDDGTFALPLRWVPGGATVSIDASDKAGVKTGTIDIKVPDDLRTSHTIKIS
jgi:hypothetical protein